ncbi:DUF3152 domain-containing protein [Streptomyces pilosus]|uniref:DUF3152 domain-containing protein n=1 Tax=Streptomyces pilosus TaxID=28893 RepID=UPI0036FAB4BB
MGRHSRRGPAPKGDTADTTAARRGRAPQAPPAQGPLQAGRPAAGGPQGYGTPYGDPAGGAPRLPDGTPAHGVPRLPDGWVPQGTPAHGYPRLPDGTPAHGVPRFTDGTPPGGVPRLPDGTPAEGVPRAQARGGHPEQREAGGGWGTVHGRTAGGPGHGRPAAGPNAPLPRQRQAPPADPRGSHGPHGPRQDYLDAFGEDVDLFTPRTPVPAPRPPDSAHPAGPRTTVTGRDDVPAAGADDGHQPPAGAPAQPRGGKGRAFTGIAAAAVTTVLAVVVAGQVTEEREAPGAQARATGEQARDVQGSASRGDQRETPVVPSAEPLTYEQKMDRTYPFAATRAGTGKFDAVPGIDKAPGTGEKITYRVDVEQGLGLDGELFADAVHKTLNDDRSWAHNGARTFERVHSGRVDWVITLASPRTTAEWCARSGLDTTEDNVSCDSAATDRVMINAYRWAQGSETYGDEIHAYRQMLINHEIGHRLGYNHVTCDKDGDLAPVMQQQTKFLEHDGISCRPNPWAYPNA